MAIDTQGGNGLAGQRYRALVIRLVLDGARHLDHGELVDEHNRVLNTFDSWPELFSALDALQAAWLNGTGTK